MGTDTIEQIGLRQEDLNARMYGLRIERQSMLHLQRMYGHFVERHNMLHFQRTVDALGALGAVLKSSLSRMKASCLGRIVWYTGPFTRGWAWAYAGNKAVAEVMGGNIGSPVVQEIGMGTLAVILRARGGHATDTHAIVDSGAVDATVAGMKAHPHNASVQTSGMYVLHCIASYHNSNDELRVTALVARGAVGAVLASMEANEAVVAVQQAGSRVLGAIACFFGDDNESFAENIKNAGGVDVIKAGMRTCRTSTDGDVPGVQEEGDKALSAIATALYCTECVICLDSFVHCKSQCKVVDTNGLLRRSCAQRAPRLRLPCGHL
jgi:hypothetical protein